MFVQAIRGIAIVFVSLLIAFAGVIGVELMSSILHPVPPGIDMSNIEACRQHVARYPTGVLFLCAIGWWLTVLASSWMATRLAPNRHLVYGIAVGVILLALAVFNMAMLPTQPGSGST
jgi:hypothetical protein